MILTVTKSMKVKVSLVDIFIPSSFQIVLTKFTDGDYLMHRGDPVGTRIYRGGYHLRPEAIESIFYMWRITGKKEFQDKAWRMFVAFVEATITEAGFSSIHYVHIKEPSKADSMESFAIAET